jgi:hypothetical protein
MIPTRRYATAFVPGPARMKHRFPQPSTAPPLTRYLDARASHIARRAETRMSLPGAHLIGVATELAGASYIVNAIAAGSPPNDPRPRANATSAERRDGPVALTGLRALSFASISS